MTSQRETGGIAAIHLQLNTGFSLKRPSFKSVLIHMRLVVDEVAMKQICLQVL